MVELYAVNINVPVEQEKINYWLSRISEEQYKRIEHFRFVGDKLRTLYGEVLIRHLAKTKLNISNVDIRILKNKYGKPFIKNYPDFHYNLSHSGDWVVCAVSTLKVGVDIEKIREIDIDIAKRFFTKDEYDSIISRPEKERLRTFFEFWTLKESYVKCLGMGLSIPLNSFNISRCNDRYILMNTKEDIHCKQMNINTDYLVAVCFKEKSLCANINYMNIQNISI